MDPALPRGGLQEYFRHYDHIMHRLRHEIPPPPNSTDPPKDDTPEDNPPWWSPDEMNVDKGNGESHRNDAPPKPSGMQNDVGFGQLIGGGLAIKGAQSQLAQNSLRATLPELAEPLLGEAATGLGVGEAALGLAEVVPALAGGLLGMAAFDKLERSMYKEKPTRQGDYSFEVDGKEVPMKQGFYKKAPLQAAPAPVTFKADEKGLDDAYANPLGTSYDPSTKSLYIKGSSTTTDWIEDATMIPFNRTAGSERYSQAKDAYDNLLCDGNKVKRGVGHSLGGSVALEMQKNLGEQGVKLDSRTFGAPVIDTNIFSHHAERYRHPTDPVSIFDRGAKWGDWKVYPHSYAGFQSFDRQPTKNALKA